MDWKKLGKRLLFPPVWLMAVLTAVSAAALTAVFVGGYEISPVAYLVYVLSFYTLSVVTVYCVLVLPGKLRSIKGRINAHPLGNRVMTDRAFRTKLSLYASLCANMLYVSIHLWFWYRLKSYWFMVLAIYYAILAVMRFLLVRYVRTHRLGKRLLGEWKRSRSCAYILLLINLSLSGAVLMILYQSKGYDYSGILIYVMAMYTFYSATHATVDIIRYRKLGSPVMSTAKIVSLSAALVSVLNLETAMFAQFGQDMSAQSQRIFIILTGAGVSVAVVTLSVLLILRATKEIRRGIYGK